MGQYTSHPTASFTFDDVYALIEMLRRIPDGGMLIDLGLPDTDRMLEWLGEMHRRDYLNQRPRWGEYRALFMRHRRWLMRTEDGQQVNRWDSEMIKVFLTVWWTMIRTEADVHPASMTFARDNYGFWAEALDIDLV